MTLDDDGLIFHRKSRSTRFRTCHRAESLCNIQPRLAALLTAAGQRAAVTNPSQLTRANVTCCDNKSFLLAARIILAHVRGERVSERERERTGPCRTLKSALLSRSKADCLLNEKYRRRTRYDFMTR